MKICPEAEVGSGQLALTFGPKRQQRPSSGKPPQTLRWHPRQPQRGLVAPGPSPPGRRRQPDASQNRPSSSTAKHQAACPPFRDCPGGASPACLKYHAAVAKKPRFRPTRDREKVTGTGKRPLTRRRDRELPQALAPGLLWVGHDRDQRPSPRPGSRRSLRPSSVSDCFRFTRLGPRPKRWRPHVEGQASTGGIRDDSYPDSRGRRWPRL